MIRVFSGGRYSFRDWATLAEILRQGLQDVCNSHCEQCPYSFACREISQAITYCDKQGNKMLAIRGKK